MAQPAIASGHLPLPRSGVWTGLAEPGVSSARMGRDRRRLSVYANSSRYRQSRSPRSG
ncbi:hypothetical protein MicB006_0210 [Micromonospora sp. B006]|nr:hypothetical protein MicB006_0210 [Micromonospora sp. B006]